MKQFLLATITLILIAGFANAGQIELRKKALTGWQYTVNGGMSYEKVGVSGNSLREAMEGNEDAQTEMNKYKFHNIIAAITAWPAGFLIGWPLGGYIASGEWEDQWTTWYAIGIPLAIISTGFEITAKGDLKRAVRIYNGEEQSVGFDVRWRCGFASTDNGTLVVGLAWSF